jgi:2-polyprenyl-6-methoxyphenol hydroxylase-like FAD-dependent oxidoreductase
MPQLRSTKICIVGGGPCGMMLGVLLARAGIDVTVLEKYADFFRDFRGDTIHPSTLELLYELGWLDAFLKLPHNELGTVSAFIGGELLQIADFSRLPTHCKFIAFMPQWDFLNFLAGRGKAYPGFHLLMETEGYDLVHESGRVAGVRARRKDGSTFEILADLVVGTDGRHSTMRERAGFVVENLGAPMDVLWMRISKDPGDPVRPLGTMEHGRMLVMIDRDTYWQCAYLIPKGTFEQLKAAGLTPFQRDVLELVPDLGQRVHELDDWSKVSLLEVRVDRLERWHRPGLLCIGDAAHAMSPIGGVGINLAIQDAVAAANMLYDALANDRPIDDALLARIQQRRTFPTKVTQAFQVFIQDRAIDPVLRGAEMAQPPLPARLLDRFSRLRGLPARLIGMGARPEHVHTPDAFAGPA